MSQAARRRRGLWWGWLLAVPALAADGEERCAAPRGPAIDGLTSIGLQLVDFPNDLAPSVAEAAALWNGAPCATAGRPRFLLGAGGERTIRVRRVAGFDDDARGVCASFARGEIRLFAFARVPGGGEPVPCVGRERLVEIVAHELGHVLGLADQRAPECAGAIMGQLVRARSGEIAPRRITAAECRAVERRLLTLAERRAGGRGAAERSAALGTGSAPAASAPPRR
jgi:hypothetical protein